MSITIHVFALAALALFSGCFLVYPKTAPPPGPPSADRSVAQGHQVFVARCGRCHDHPDIGSVAAGEWPEIIDRMAKKAELDADQKRALSHFILAIRAETND